MVIDIIKRHLLPAVALLALAACDKPYSLDLPLAVDSHEYTLTSKAGEARIFFYTTKAWTISLDPADCPWAYINKKSGNGKSDVEEVVFTYEKNPDPDRQVALVIAAGNLKEKITMFQTGVAREWWDGSFGIDDLNPVNPVIN